MRSRTSELTPCLHLSRKRSRRSTIGRYAVYSARAHFCAATTTSAVTPSRTFRSTKRLQRAKCVGAIPIRTTSPSSLRPLASAPTARAPRSRKSTGTANTSPPSSLPCAINSDPRSPNPLNPLSASRKVTRGSPESRPVPTALARTPRLLVKAEAAAAGAAGERERAR